LFIESPGIKALYLRENKKKKRGVKESEELRNTNKKLEKMVE
jgi:hypothetical protein